LIKTSPNKKLISLKRQPLVLLIFSSISFLLILFRLIFLQLLNYDTFKKMSDENRIRLIASQPIRGRILDKNGYVLADSRVKYSLIIKPQSVNKSNWENHKSSISNLFNIDSNVIQKKYSDGLKNQKFSVIILDDLNVDQLIKFKENEDNLISFEIATKLIRNYPFKSLAAHVIGYTQPVTDSEYKFLSNKGYKLNDLIGRTGIEYVYEDLIRGEWGGEMVEVNSLGKFQRSLGIKPAKKGNDIQLTIDMNLQLVAEEVLKDKKAGAIIVMDPRDGAIRAMTSKPTFDLNFFSKNFKPEKEYNKLFNSPEKPLFNRALNAYDPGSVWKIVTALAGLESGKFPRETMLETKPCITYGSQCFREHNDLGFGVIGYEDALRVSSNTFFYQVGYGVGVDEIHKVSRKLGFNSLSGIEIAEAMEIDVEELDSVLRQALSTSSLDAPVNGDDGRSFLGDLIADSNNEEPLDQVEQKMHQEQLGKWLSHLSEQEQHVLKLRFGLDANERHTLAEIGRLLEVSRERVRQVELKALRKLRNLTRKLPSGI